ncbi:MAG: transglutaminaseTgpA domain-containing protein [Acidimicrobiales bacterium]
MSVLAFLKRANTNPPPEGSTALRASVLVAVMAAALGLVTQHVTAGLLGPAVLIGIPVGSVCSHLARHRPGYLRKVLVAVLAALALVRFLSAAAGASGEGLTELRVPLAELFLVVQVLHSFDLPSRRDLLFSLLSSLALVLVGGVLSTSPAFGPYLAVWGVAGTVSLTLAHRSRLAELPRLGGPPGLPADPGRSRWRSARPVAGTTALALTVAAATFLVLPAAGSPQLLGAPARVAGGAPIPLAGSLSNPTLGAAQPGRSGGRTSFGYFGFARSLDLSARGRPDGTPVMRVRASRPDFWRGQSFDRWDGHSWRISNEKPIVVPNQSPFDLPPPPEDKLVQYLGEPLVQTFYLQRPQPNVVFSAYKADQLYLPSEAVFALDDGTVRTGFELEAGTVYTVVSRRPKVTATALRAAPPEAPGLPPSFLSRYTQLPEVAPAVRDLARELTAAAPTTYDKVLALEAWMGATTTYSLDIPPLPDGADPVSQFLFVDRKGFCEQIATSLVVLLRSLGVPARLAVGYTPGERDPFTGLYQVRARDAHAWAEVYFPRLGWQAFDPTADVPLAGDSAASANAPDVLSFLSGRLPSLSRRAPQVGLAAGAAALLGTLALEAGAWRRRRRRTRSRTWAAACVDRLEAVGARHGRRREPWETTREYAEALVGAAVIDPQLLAAATILDAEQFSPAPVDDEQRRLVESALDQAG